jgi:hypothetical protein
MLNSIVSMLALIALTLPAASLDSQQHGQSQLEGVWESHVTLTDCNGHTIAAFLAYEAFASGGTLTSTDNTPPTLHGPGLGTWRHLGGRNYAAPFQFFNFNADGSFAGVQKINRQIVVAPNGHGYTSTVAFASYDPNGNLLFQGCGTETAVRLP